MLVFGAVNVTKSKLCTSDVTKETRKIAYINQLHISLVEHACRFAVFIDVSYNMLRMTFKQRFSDVPVKVFYEECDNNFSHVLLDNLSNAFANVNFETFL